MKLKFPAVITLFTMITEAISRHGDAKKHVENVITPPEPSAATTIAGAGGGIGIAVSATVGLVAIDPKVSSDMNYWRKRAYFQSILKGVLSRFGRLGK